MKSRMYGVLTAFLGAIVLMLAANEAFAASRGASRGGAHLASHRLAGHFRHHRGQQQGAFFWPGFDNTSYGPADSSYGPAGGAFLDGSQPLSGDIRSSNASDIPWDWAHRYPPAVVPSGRPYVSNCGAESVTVPDGRGGNGQVNIVRCY